MIPVSDLDALVDAGLTGSQLRVALVVLAAPETISSGRVAQRLGIDRSLAKRIVRSLTGRRILVREPGGLSFQPDASRWLPRMAATFDENLLALGEPA